ncbi:valine--tRNA ligase [Fodinisporobacter ferrooxydans]|uniref:Valine--tRNA ligase n=2 Tax=Fodinisporobacter ferrooxydans TaxID=2901836 RepID=A0ABY4CR18_9BACL|nr:valine--tRNA ligase [Alicyclobacillaceae bacterium MYW30-H2]
MSTVYDPKLVEQRLYQFWLDQGCFTAGKEPEKQPYAIVIPPPNVTGQLHIGHALNFTLQDILIRWKRLSGFDALWLPGTDHAGIATQTRVEAILQKEEGVSRHDLGREKFIERVWDWKHKYGNIITNQMKNMGCSVDWSRERFTMDEGLCAAVREVFVRLYEKGLIYRGNRIINWCTRCQTALSDIEVEHEEKQGALYHLRYPLVDGSGHLIVATTRPETMLGDVAVAVHPDDARYRHLLGKRLRLPLAGREIPIIADEYVEMDFGTGCVKMTPAHDPNDFEVGQRHDLENINILNQDGTLNELAGKYAGMDRFAARKQVVADLEAQGFVEKIEEHTHAVGHCTRCSTIVEPYLSDQWFVKMEPLAKPAIRVVEEGQVQFIPERFAKIYMHWMENVRDWCISRQLWWGHRIPAWYCEDCGGTTVVRKDPDTCSHCGSSRIHQEEDVLDTWFSSALWPFSTMGWPNETNDLKRYFPTNVLVTGFDIIYFWVARMIFSALEFTDEAPFHDVVIHGLVRDAQGRKMSKSLGNGIDPLEVIEQYGADALRFMLASGTTLGNDLRFHFERVENARNFANKIWNASRYVLMNISELSAADIELGDLSQYGTADRWILHRLNETAKDMQTCLSRYDFGEATRIIYEFIWNEFCDWYIELSKLYLYGQDEGKKRQSKIVLVYVLDRALRLLHPFMPFITEEIWQHLPHTGTSISLAEWPVDQERFVDASAVSDMELLMELIRSVRNVRAEMNVPPSKPVTLLIKPTSEEYEQKLVRGTDYITRFCNPDTLEIDRGLSVPEKTVTAVLTGAEVYLPLAGLIDLDAEIARLEKEVKTLNEEVDRLDKKLSNTGFAAKAPAHVVEAEKNKRDDYADKRQKVLQRIAELKA